MDFDNIFVTSIFYNHPTICVLIIVLASSLLTCVFPIYYTVYHKIKNTSENNDQFQIINTFHKTVTRFYKLIIIFLFLVPIIYALNVLNILPLLVLVPITLAVIISALLLCISETHQILLGLLGVYCICTPSIRKYLKSSKNIFKCVIYFLYFIFLSKVGAFIFYRSYDCEKALKIFLYAYTGLYIFLIFVVLLNIPNFIRLLKSTTQVTYLTKYASSQLIFILVEKTVYILTIYIYDFVFEYFIICQSAEIISTLLIIQITYLVCNKEMTKITLKSLCESKSCKRNANVKQKRTTQPDIYSLQVV